MVEFTALELDLLKGLVTVTIRELQWRFDEERHFFFKREIQIDIQERKKLLEKLNEIEPSEIE